MLLKILLPCLTSTKGKDKWKRAFYKFPANFENSRKISYYPRGKDAHAFSSFRLMESSLVFVVQLSSVCGKHHYTEPNESCSRPR